MFRRVVVVVVINLVVFLAGLLLLDVSYSAYHYRFLGNDTHWIFEDTGKTVHFDPVSGFRLTDIPSRIARVTRGKIEYLGYIKGNNFGFPDRDDFSPDRPDTSTKRYAIFGDSFSAAPYLAVNWPDRAEDLLKRAGEQVELLNFSVDGAGLANWANIVDQLIRTENFQLDGIIIATITDDLERPFTFTDSRDRTRWVLRRAGWNPELYPKDLQSALETLPDKDQGMPSVICMSEEFSPKVLQAVSRKDRVFKFRLLARASKWFTKQRRGRRIERPIVKPATLSDKDTIMRNRSRQVEVIRAFAKERNLPVLVVHIPLKEEALGKQQTKATQLVQAFSDLIQARYIDGREAFAGVTTDQLNQLWLPFDGHWGQGASDLFAEFISWQVLSDLQKM